MLYWLYEFLEINLFFYITVRATFAFFIAFAGTLWLMPKFIAWAKQKHATQPIYVYAPDGHKEKKNTPTMGGVVFLGMSLFATFLSADLSNTYILFGIALLLLYGGIGMLDDIGKVFKRNNAAGLSSKAKLVLQVLVALFVSTSLYVLTDLPTHFYVPFLKTPLFDMGVGAIFFWTLVITAASNAVNLTDGLDGLATVPSIFSFISLAILVYISGHAILSASLLLPKIMGIGETVVIAASFIGGLVGFLWYNAHPAQVFMGDSGSLTIGALIGYLGVLAKSEVLLLVIGFIFVVETLSVIVQVTSFKLRKRRIFLMAPLHHHFELKQWAENKIIVRFWIVALISNLFAIITIKIR
jgi:phospho-N-acetylmuramoyl-pentapeptide-transferase